MEGRPGPWEEVSVVCHTCSIIGGGAGRGAVISDRAGVSAGSRRAAPAGDNARVTSEVTRRPCLGSGHAARRRLDDSGRGRPSDTSQAPPQKQLADAPPASALSPAPPRQPRASVVTAASAALL